MSALEQTLANAFTSNRSTRVLLECGNTLISGGNTGIQRVARNLARNGQSVAIETGINCLPVLAMHSGLLDGTSWLLRLEQSIAKPPDTKARFNRLDASPGKQTNLQRVLSLFNLENFRRVAARELYALRSPRVSLCSSDILIFSDVWWFDRLTKLQRYAEQKGVRTGIIVYDLLPIRHPEFFPPSLEVKFREFLDNYLQHCHFFLTISETVASDLRSYATERFGESHAARLRIDAFRLGSDLDLMSKGGTVDPNAIEFFSRPDQPTPYLTIGTVEPRKNHNYLLDAFEKVWEECPTTRLCILGRPGWLNEPLIRRIEAHPRLGKQLIWLSNASDTDLQYCYKNSKALVSTSKAEGFGLPLIEGLRHGIPVIASDIPVHREAGDVYCSYVNLSDPTTLSKVIIQAEREGIFPKVTPWNPKLLTDWKTSARDFLQKCTHANAPKESIVS